MLTVTAKRCPVPKSIPIGSLRYTGLIYNSLAIYSCPNGYLLSGYKQRVCKKDGTWAGTPPKCIQRGRCKWYNFPCIHNS